MDINEFQILSNDLQMLRTNIPLRWGVVQNNKYDDNIEMFKISTYVELERRLNQLDDLRKDYLRRRWYLWKCSQCDEFLFYINNNVIKNPNKYDKEWDIKINNKYIFDVKGTVIPKAMRCEADNLISNPERMIDFFYDEQSKGRRFDIQNRLFLVHHSFVSEERELYLRSAWKSKRNIYKLFCEQIDNVKLYNTHNVYASVIFILERELGKVDYKIYGL